MEKNTTGILNDLIERASIVEAQMEKLKQMFDRMLGINHEIEKKVNFSALTNHELKILKLVGDNKSNQEIAKILGISKRTVESHRSNMKIKLGLKKGKDLVEIAKNSNQ